MFDMLIDIDWSNEDLGMFLLFVAPVFLWVAWMLLSSIVQAKHFVNDEPLRFWSNPLRKTGSYGEDYYDGLFSFASVRCDIDDKAADCVLMLVTCYFFFWILLICNVAWLPVTIIAGVIASLYGARAIVRLKKALTKHVEDKNAHGGNE